MAGRAIAELEAGALRLRARSRSPSAQGERKNGPFDSFSVSQDERKNGPFDSFSVSQGERKNGPFDSFSVSQRVDQNKLNARIWRDLRDVMLTSDPPVRRRVRRDPKPHFRPDVSRQLDAVRGCPEVQVPEDHLARAVRRLVELFDTSLLEENYSSLGRHGFHPRQVLAVWLYGSMTGTHESTKLAAAMETDAALRLLSGGHAISAGTLRRFRQRNRAFFEDAIAQTVRMAHDLGLLRRDQLGVDSVRLRAHAATSAARTLVRSRKRLAELLDMALEPLSDDERARHEGKIAKHRDAIARCEAEGRTNLVITNPEPG